MAGNRHPGCESDRKIIAVARRGLSTLTPKGSLLKREPLHPYTFDRSVDAVIENVSHPSWKRNVTAIPLFLYCFFTGDSAMHSLCTRIALHLHIGSEMNIFVPRLAMQCLFLLRKGMR